MHVDHLLDLICTTIDATVRTGIHVLVCLVYIFLGVLKYPVFEATHAHTAARQESTDEADIEEPVANRTRLLPSVVAGRWRQRTVSM